MIRGLAVYWSVVLAVAVTGCTTVEEPFTARGGSRSEAIAKDGPRAQRSDSQFANDVAGAPKEDSEQRRRAKIRLELAAGFYQQGNYGQALEELRMALATDATFAQAYGLLGLVYMALDDGARAEESFQRALRLTPNDAEILNNYGWFLCQTGRPRESIARFEASLKDPLYVTPSRSLQNAGICMLRAGNEAAAETYLLRSFQVDPTNPVAMYQLGQLYLKRGDLVRARFQAQRLLTTHPASAETVWFALLVERRAGNQDAVATFAARLRREFPASPEASLLQRGAFGD